MEEKRQIQKHTVVVTGFGPFGNFPTNPSWVVAKELANLDFDDEGVTLIVHEVPVIYDTVIEKVPLLWEEHSPQVRIISLTTDFTTFWQKIVRHQSCSFS